MDTDEANGHAHTAPQAGQHHLRLVVDAPRPAAGGEHPDDATATGLAVSGEATDIESVDPAAPWTSERVLGLLEVFRDTPWGSSLSGLALDGLEAVLLAPETHSFRGAAGIPFLADCLNAASLERNLGDLAVVELRAVPAGLRRWVRYVDRLGSGVDPSITLTKLEYIDRLEPAWQESVTRLDRRRRLNRPGLVARMHELAADLGREIPAGPLQLDDASEVFAQISLDPLPDEPLQLAGLDPDTALRVLEIADWSDHFFRLAQTNELRTAARRLLVLVARCGPEALRRPTARALAAGIAYAVIHGNFDRFHRYDWLGTTSLAEELGVSGSGIPARARSLLAAAGIDQPPVDDDIHASLRRKLLRLGDPGLLTARRRELLTTQAGNIVGRLIECES